MELRIIIDDRIVRAFVAVKRVFPRKRLASLVAGVTLCSVAVVAAEPISPPYVFSSGTTIVAAEINESFSGIYQAFSDHVIRADMTFPVAVAEGCSGIRTAILRVAEYHVLPTAMVSIELAPGTYPCGASSVVLSDLFWPRVQLVGGGASPSDTELTFAGGTTGMQISRSVIAEINNLTITGGNPDASSGVSLTDGAEATLESLHISGFRDGVYLSSNASASTSDVTSSGNGRSGFRAYRSSALNIESGTQAVDNASSGIGVLIGSSLVVAAGTTIQGGNYGVDAQTGSFAYLSGASLSGQSTAAVRANLDASINVTDDAEIADVPLAYTVSQGGSIRATSAVSYSNVTAEANIAIGVAADDNSFVNVDN